MDNNILFKCVFGSHLYGTNTPKSDNDYKGIFLPKLRELVLGRYAKHITENTKLDSTQKNTEKDIDCEIYSLHYFLELAYINETVAMDMLHVPKDKTIITSKEWEFLQNNRHKFYTKNMRAFVGYCRTQASKYGVKGSRLNDVKTVIDFLEKQDRNKTLVDLWDNLPTGENISKYEHLESKQEDKRVYDVCQRKLQVTTPISKHLESLYAFHKRYGERAKLAANSEGIDFKAISHAFRAGYQAKEILTTGDLVFPLRQAEFIKKIKSGTLHYKNDGIGEMLDNLVDEVVALGEKSTFPEKVDRDFFESWLLTEVYRI